MEFSPLIRETEAVFAAHFTNTDSNFQAVTQGNVTLTLFIDGRSFKTTALKPAAPGIFRLALLPRISGMGKLQFDIHYGDVRDQILIDSVPVFNDEKSAQDFEPNSATGEITYLKEQSWKTEFATSEVSKSSTGPVIKATGKIIAAPGDAATIVAPAAGIVYYADPGIIAGAKVRKGETIFRITGGTVTQNVKNAYSVARLNYEKAKSDYDRASELVKDRIISQKEFLESKSRFDNAGIAYNNIAMNYSGESLMIKSPADGYLRSVLVKDGDFAEAGVTLGSVASNKSVFIQTDLSLRYADIIPEIQYANVLLPLQPGERENKVIRAERISYGRSVTAGPAFIPVTFKPETSDRLLPGSVSEINLILKPDSNGIMIPRSAVTEEQGNHYVFVQVTAETFRKQEILTGTDDGIMVEVKSGLQPGERIITRGAYAVKLAAATGIIPEHGHEH